MAAIATSILAVLRVATARMALNEATLGSEMQHMLGLPFEITMPMIYVTVLAAQRPNRITLSARDRPNRGRIVLDMRECRLSSFGAELALWVLSRPGAARSPERRSA